MTKDIIDAIASGDNLGAETHFKDAMQTRVANGLETKRKDVDMTMVTKHIPEVEDDEEELQSD